MKGSLLLIFLFVITGFAACGQTSPKRDSVKSSNEKSVFVKVDKSAEFPGGIRKFYEYVSQNIKSSAPTNKEAVYKKVYVEFVINADGSIDGESVRVVPSSEVLKSTEASTVETVKDEASEQEAIRIIKECPDWKPALTKDKPVNQKLVLPIVFK